ncbi:MAG: D-amino-acid transaminase [Gemmatimonadetes bacterium]|nr:D-amino-acid transaminase [Gemmatimonadota bacterium]
MLVYLNGRFQPREKAFVSVDDRGFVFGDGVYEVIRVVDGRLFTSSEHLARMEEGLHTIGIDRPADMTPARIVEIAERLLGENDLLDGHATVYLQITRGAAVRTHFFPTTPVRPTIFISTARFSPAPDLLETGASAVTCPDVRWSRCNLKTLNLLANVLAKQSAVDKGAVEAIFVRDGVVTEGSSTNVFVAVDGQLHTFPICNYILAGITRGVVLELAGELGIQVHETPARAEDLVRADEIFLTGTTTDVLPIVEIDGRPVGSGTPGPLALALGRALAERMSPSPANAGL